jgi:hypothetical protein
VGYLVMLQIVENEAVCDPVIKFMLGAAQIFAKR